MRVSWNSIKAAPGRAHSRTLREVRSPTNLGGIQFFHARPKSRLSHGSAPALGVRLTWQRFGLSSRMGNSEVKAAPGRAHSRTLREARGPTNLGGIRFFHARPKSRPSHGSAPALGVR